MEKETFTNIEPNNILKEEVSETIPTPLPVPEEKIDLGKQLRDDLRKRKNIRRKPQRRAVPRSEFDQKMISLRRVARVVAGGRRFTFSAALIIGDHKGSVGVGIGKGADTALAIEKALRDAKKQMIKLNLTKGMSIPYEVLAKYSSARVFIKPGQEGRGLVAGRAVRTVLELAGVKDVTAKILSGSKNQVNNARVAIAALSEFSTRKK
ncbi:MAG: 30S ribosomal protein S5 [Patescibacteria group bacterium]